MGHFLSEWDYGAWPLAFPITDGDSVSECENNIHDTIMLVGRLGFVVNYEKSVLKPTKNITFLGNIIDSTSMTVTLTERRKDALLFECKKLYGSNKAKIRDVAKVWNAFAVLLCGKCIIWGGDFNISCGKINILIGYFNM